MTADSSSREAAGRISLVPRGPNHPDSVALLRRFHREQVERYGFAESVDLDPAEYTTPIGMFVVLYDHDRAVGCGALRWHDRRTATAEIKKTYLLPAARKRGLGRLLLESLETEAVAWGAERVVLETGVRNTAALALFAASGYQPTACYVPGRDPAVNRAFMKVASSPRLAEGERRAICG